MTLEFSLPYFKNLPANYSLVTIVSFTGRSYKAINNYTQVH